MQRSTLAKRAWLMLMVAACAVYVAGLGRIPLIGPDEPRYAQVAREMFERGDLVTPTLGGLTWFEKPVLAYWAMMANFQLFGVSEWSARLGSAVVGLLTIALAGWLARRVETANGEQANGFGLSCAATTASCAGLIIFSRGASFDIFLTFALTAALACFFISELESEARARRFMLAGFYAGVGAALLAKGLVGVVIPLGILALYFVFRRSWPQVSKLGWWWGTLVALAVAATWYAPIIAQHGWKFIDEFFIQHHFARYVSNKYNHPQPFYYYVPVVLMLSLPWSAFLVAGVARAARTNRRAGDAATRLRLYALAWLLMPVLFFSLSGSKLPGYILPALPGGMLLAGEQLSRYARGEGNVGAMRLTGLLLLLLVTGGAIYSVNVGLVSISCALIIATPVATVGALAAFAAAHKRKLCAVSVVAATLLLVALITTCGLEKVGETQSLSALLERARARGYASTPVLHLHDIERTSEFYAAGRITYDAEGQPARLEGPGEVANILGERGGAALVIVPLQYITQLTGAPFFETEVIGDNGWDALVAVRMKKN